MLTLTLTSFQSAAAITPAPLFGYLPDTEVSDITVEGKSQPVLIRAWEGKKRLGAAILLANTGTNADAPGLMAHLRRHLNAKGWATISLMPPDESANPSFATDANEVSKAGGEQLTMKSTDAVPKYTDEQQQAQLDAQLANVSSSLSQIDSLGTEYPGKRLLITTDQSAGLVIRLLNEHKIPVPDILVVINPYMINDGQNRLIAKQLADMEIPVLDIISPDAHPASSITAKSRYDVAGIKPRYLYRQQALQLNLNQPIAWANCQDVIVGFAHTILQL